MSASTSKHQGTSSRICFKAVLHRPAEQQRASWLFLRLPEQASARLPSRGMISIEGTINGARFQATLEPDGQGGHWLKVDQRLRRAMATTDGRGPEAGDMVKLDVSPLPPERQLEPALPADLRKAISAAPKKAQDAWQDITPAARRDFVQWIESAKKEQTRAKRIAAACDMLAKGKRRPCCFDRSGIYAKNMSCPVAED